MGEAGGQQQAWTPGSVALSLALFLVAGVSEVGGGWLVWQALREVSVEKNKAKN